MLPTSDVGADVALAALGATQLNPVVDTEIQVATDAPKCVEQSSEDTPDER